MCVCVCESFRGWVGVCCPRGWRARQIGRPSRAPAALMAPHGSPGGRGMGRGRGRGGGGR